MAYGLNRFTTYIFVSASTFILPEVFLHEEKISEKKGQERIQAIENGFSWVLSCNLAAVTYVFISSLCYKLIENRKN